MNSAHTTANDQSICIVIPTFCRSEGLKSAVRSVFNQNIMNEDIQIIVVDNNKTPIEQTAVHKLSDTFKHSITYIHEPLAGVSNARNAAMTLAMNSRFIAFLDDDMVVSEHWLDSLITTALKYDAGLVFGPTHAVMPNKNDARNKYMRPFFSRLIDKAEDGIIEKTLGTGGCLLDLTHCQIPSPPFDPELNEQGGEDDIFFDKLRQTGTAIAWSVDAVSYEIVPAIRATNRYIWKRNFGYGQGPTRIQSNRGAVGIPGIAYFMMTGLIQCGLYAPSWGVNKLLHRPSQVKYSALTARALGKVFWHKSLSPLLYGNASPQNCP